MFSLVPMNSLFLSMLPLVAVPILFHLFLRMRKRTRPFPSLMFFRQADPKMQARRKIREWLALLLRMLVILFLLLALSRPVWLGGKAGGPVAAVLVVDNSGSMSASGSDGRTKLALALQGAEALIASLAPSDTAALVLLVDDVTVALPEGLVADHQALRAALGRIEPTEATGTPGRALERAAALLSATSASRREIHVFTDLQNAEWGREPAQLPALPFNAVLAVHRIDAPESRPARNVSLAGIRLPNRRLLAQRPYTLRVDLLNTSDAAAPVRVAVVNASGKQRMMRADLPAHAARALSVPMETASPGTGWMRIHVENDDFAPDNTGYVAYTSEDRQPVWFMGDAHEFGLLADAMSPAGEGLLSGLKPTFKKGPFSLPGPDDAHPALVVCTWHDLPMQKDAETALRQYVREGGSLLVVPGTSERRNAVSLPPWLGVSVQQPIVSDRGQPVLVFDRQAAVWDELRDESGDVMLKRVRAFRFYPLTVQPSAQALAGLEDGRTLLAQQALGKGRTYVSGTAFDATWTTLPLKAGFLPLVQSLAVLAQSLRTDSAPLVAGQCYRAGTVTNAPLRLRTVTGSPMDWRGEATETPPLPRSGVYAVDVGEQTRYIAVRSSDLEGKAAYVREDSVPVLGNAAHAVYAYHDRESFIRGVRRRRSGMNLYLPLVLLALAAATLEACIVNPLPRKVVQAK